MAKSTGKLRLTYVKKVRKNKLTNVKKCGKIQIEINNYRKSTGKFKLHESEYNNILIFLCFSIINKKSGWKLKKMHRISIFKARFIDDSSSLTFSDFSVSCLCLLLVNSRRHSVWKSPKMSHFSFFTKMDHFWHFQWTFVHSKCKRSSLRSQCWMRLFLWFSNHRVDACY